MRVTEDASNSSRFRVGFVTIAIQFQLAEGTRAASDIKRNQNVIAGFEVLNTRSNLFHNTREFVTERHAYTRIRNQSVV